MLLLRIQDSQEVFFHLHLLVIMQYLIDLIFRHLPEDSDIHRELQSENQHPWFLSLRLCLLIVLANTGALPDL